MECEGLVEVDGAALSRCLFLIWQAWAKPPAAMSRRA